MTIKEISTKLKIPEYMIRYIISADYERKNLLGKKKLSATMEIELGKKEANAVKAISELSKVPVDSVIAAILEFCVLNEELKVEQHRSTKRKSKKA